MIEWAERGRIALEVEAAHSQLELGREATTDSRRDSVLMFVCICSMECCHNRISLLLSKVVAGQL
jgi:hypothetical protein